MCPYIDHTIDTKATDQSREALQALSHVLTDDDSHHICYDDAPGTQTPAWKGMLLLCAVIAAFHPAFILFFMCSHTDSEVLLFAQVH